MEPSFYYILLSIVIISIFFSWLKSETIFNPTSIFISWWGLLVFISSLNLIGMRLPSMQTYNLLLLTMTCFSIGSITFMNPKPIKKKLKVKFLRNHNLKLVLFFLFQIVITITLLLLLRKTVSILTTLNPGTFRGLVYSEDGIFKGHKLFVSYILRPSLFISTFISISGVILGVLKKRYMVIAFINMLLYSMVILGRSSIFMIMLSLIFGIIYIMTIKKIRIQKKYILLLFLPLVALVYMSVFRKGENNTQPVIEIFKTYSVWYFTGPFTAFDYFLHTYKPEIDYDYSIIRGVTAGFEQMLLPFIKKAFSFYKDINAPFHEITAPFRSLGGPATHHNSHFTMLYTFFRDGGVFGIIIYSYLLGMINSIIFNKLRFNTSLYNFALMILITYLSIIGVMRWELRYSWSWMIIIGTFFVVKQFVIGKTTNMEHNV